MHLPGFMITFRNEKQQIRYSIMLQPPGGSARNAERLAAFIIDEGEVVQVEYTWPESATDARTFDLEFYRPNNKRQVAIATALKEKFTPGTKNSIVSTMYIEMPQKVDEKFFVLPSFGGWQASGADVIQFVGRKDEYYFIELVTSETDTAPATPGVFTVKATRASAGRSGRKDKRDRKSVV